MDIYKKLAEIQQNLNAPKNQFNKFGKYNYRNCEDTMEALKPLLGDFTVTLTDSIEMIGDRFYVKATARLAAEISMFIEVNAYARESLDKKGMDVSQITGAASSYARKYALNGLFLIDDNKDADSQDNTEVKKGSKKKADTSADIVKKMVVDNNIEAIKKEWSGMIYGIWDFLDENTTARLNVIFEEHIKLDDSRDNINYDPKYDKREL